MKCAPFRLAVPQTVEEAVALLTEVGDDVRLLAGGQSLMPLMVMREVSPSLLIDLGRVAGLDHVTVDPGGVVIGAMTRQRTAERNPDVARHAPLLALAIPNIAHVTIRNQGTVGGSIANADPTSEIPVAALASDATMTVAGPDGTRSVAAADFFVGVRQTCLARDELLLDVRFPTMVAGSGSAFEELSRRPGDVAIVSVAAVLQLDGDGRICAARLAIGSVASTPIRAVAAESMLIGQPPSAELFGDVGRAVAASIDPPDDLNGTGAYRRYLAGVLVGRALFTAAARTSS